MNDFLSLMLRQNDVEATHTHTHCLPVVSLQQHSKQWKCKWLVLRLHCLPYSASTSAQFYPERSWMLSHFRQTRNLKGGRLSVERSWPRRRAELKFPNPACKLSLSPQSCSDAGLQPGREPQLFGSSCHTEQWGKKYCYVVLIFFYTLIC